MLRTIGESGMRSMPCSADSDIRRTPMIIARGSRGFPVAFAGQAAVQRPHSVHAKPSKTSFQPRSARVRMPNVASSRSRSIAGSWPRGSSLRSQMLMKLV